MEIGFARSYLCPATVGRAAEQSRLRDHLLNRNHGIALIAGEAGIGKSRLVNDLATFAREHSLNALVARCYETDSGFPFAPIRDVLRVVAQEWSPARVARLVGSGISALVQILPELATSESSVLSNTDQDQGKRALFEAADALFAERARSTPVLFAVEDLHWADPVTLEFLLFLTRRSAGRPITLVATYRLDEIADDLAHLLAALDRERLAHDIPLRGFGPTETDAMLREIFRLNHPAPAELIHMLTTLTDGNPFFIEEVLTSMGNVVSSEGRFALPAMDSLRIPRSVQDAVRRRSGQVSQEARRVLAVAAISGRRFRFSLLQSVTGQDERALLTSLKELIAARLVIEESGETFLFRHALTREAVYAELLTRERQSLHRDVAEALEHLAKSEKITAAERAEHHFAGGNWQRAIALSIQAGEEASALYAPRSAIAHYTRAIEALRRLGHPADAGLLMSRAAAYEVVGEFDHALADYEAAALAARSEGSGRLEVQARLSLGLLWAARDYREAGAAIQAALDSARDLDAPAIIAQCLNRLGNWHLNCEQPQEALRCHQEALAIVERLADPRRVAETLDLLGLTSLFAGDMTSGSAYLARAVDSWTALGERRGLASSLILRTMRGATFHTDTVPAVATHAELEPDCQLGLEIARAIGWRAGESWALWMLGGMNLAAAGIYDRAFSLLNSAREIATEIDHRQWLAAIYCMTGNAFADLLDLRTAETHAGLALEYAREAGAPYWERSATAWLAAILVRQGQLDAANELLAGSLKPDLPMQTPATRLLWRSRAMLSLSLGNAVEAMEVLDRLVSTAPGSDLRPIPQLELLRGEALLALGQIGDAEVAFQRALRTSAVLGTDPVRWRAAFALARLYQTLNRDEETDSMRREGDQVIARILPTIPDDALRSTFSHATAGYRPILDERRHRQRERARLGGLSDREIEVARLLTFGKTNRAIAEAMFITEWTAATHVRNILAKLDLTSRTQIATWAVAHGLADDANT